MSDIARRQPGGFDGSLNVSLYYVRSEKVWELLATATHEAHHDLVTWIHTKFPVNQSFSWHPSFRRFSGEGI